MEFLVRTKDPELQKALTLFLESHPLPLPLLILTDLDDFLPENAPYELTFSYEKEEAALIRPFSFPELLSKAEALCPKEKEPALVLKKNCFYLHGKALLLTSLEFRLLSLLYAKKGGIVTKEEASTALFKGQDHGNQLNVYIHYLRKKTAKPGEPPLIATARGKGFYINV